MSNLGVSIAYEALRSLGFASIGASYSGVGTPFGHPARMVIITNTTNQDLLISYDGLTDNDIVPASTAKVLDYGSNMALNGGASDQAQHTRVYVKYFVGIPSDGGVFVTVIYLSTGY
jgi:hypothetical protein